MKALASLVASLVLASAIPAAPGPHAGAVANRSALGGYEPGRHGGWAGGRFDGGSHDRHEHGHFFGGSWIAPDFYAGVFPDAAPAPYDAPENPYRSHFVGASWIVPGPYLLPPPAFSDPRIAAPPVATAQSGPKILYLTGKPAKSGKEPVVIYGAYK